MKHESSPFDMKTNKHTLETYHGTKLHLRNNLMMCGEISPVERIGTQSRKRLTTFRRCQKALDPAGLSPVLPRGAFV